MELQASFNLLLNTETHSSNQLNVFNNVVNGIQNYYDDGAYDEGKPLDYDMFNTQVESVPSKGENGDPLIAINSSLNSFSCTDAIGSSSRF